MCKFAHDKKTHFFIETFYQTPRVQHKHYEFIVSFQSLKLPHCTQTYYNKH